MRKYEVAKLFVIQRRGWSQFVLTNFTTGEDKNFNNESQSLASVFVELSTDGWQIVGGDEKYGFWLQREIAQEIPATTGFEDAIDKAAE